jgi:hypothetical protein
MDSMDTSENNHQHESVASLAKRFEKLAEDLGAQNNVNGFVDNGLCQSKTNQGTKSPTVQVKVFIVNFSFVHVILLIYVLMSQHLNHRNGALSAQFVV